MKRLLILAVAILLLTSASAWGDWGVGPVGKYNINRAQIESGVEGMVTAFSGYIKAFGDFTYGADFNNLDRPYGAEFEVIYDMAPKKTLSLYISGGANHDWLRSEIDLETAVNGGVGFGIALHWWDTSLQTKTSGMYLGYQALSIGADDHEISFRLILAL